jgi:hypothetical protein
VSRGRLDGVFPALLLLGLLGSWSATVVPMALGHPTIELYPMSAYPMFSTDTDAVHRRYYAIAEGPGNETAEIDAALLFDGQHALDSAQTLRILNGAWRSAHAGCDDFRLQRFSACPGNATAPWSAPPDLAGLWLDSAHERLGWQPSRLVLAAETTDLSIPPGNPGRVVIDRFGLAEPA